MTSLNHKLMEPLSTPRVAAELAQSQAQLYVLLVVR